MERWCEIFTATWSPHHGRHGHSRTTLASAGRPSHPRLNVRSQLIFKRYFLLPTLDFLWWSFIIGYDNCWEKSRQIILLIIERPFLLYHSFLVMLRPDIQQHFELTLTPHFLASQTSNLESSYSYAERVLQNFGISIKLILDALSCL